MRLALVAERRAALVFAALPRSANPCRSVEGFHRDDRRVVHDHCTRERAGGTARKAEAPRIPGKKFTYADAPRVSSTAMPAKFSIPRELHANC